MLMIIEPTGGLANRMRAIDSAIAFANQNNSKLHVLWFRNRDCNCRFHLLFETPKEVNALIDLRSGLLSRIIRKLIKFFLSAPSNVYLDHSVIEQLKTKSGSAFTSINLILENISRKSLAYVQTFHRFYETPAYKRYSSLKPIPQLRKKINTLDLSNHVGIHIRRTDNHKSIENSPLEGFVTAMQREISINQDVLFFLSTDDPESVQRLEEVFPRRITTRKVKSLDRNDPSAIQEALMDLYSLANCRKIIGSYWSSFTDVAAEINQIEKCIIVRKSKPDYISDITF